MEREITISKDEPYRMYLPKSVGDKGFCGGKAVMLANRITLTIVRPDIDADSEEGIDAIKKSLEIMIQDLELHKKTLGKQNKR